MRITRPRTEQESEAPWRSVTATVLACSETLLSRWTGDSVTSEGGYEASPYIIAFSYVVDGKTYYGKLKLGSPRAAGHTFEIQYDPLCPEENTGSDRKPAVWFRVLIYILGTLMAILLIWMGHRLGISD